MPFVHQPITITNTTRTPVTSDVFVPMFPTVPTEGCKTLSIDTTDPDSIDAAGIGIYFFTTPVILSALEDLALRSITPTGDDWTWAPYVSIAQDMVGDPVEIVYKAKTILKAFLLPTGYHYLTCILDSSKAGAETVRIYLEGPPA